MHSQAVLYDRSLRPRLMVGAVLSVLAHGLLVVVVVTRGGDLSGASPRLLSPPETAPTEPPTPVGIEQSEAVSINWLGFADPTEHEARQAESEQAEMSPETPGKPVLAEAESEPVEAEVADLEQVEPEPLEAEPVEVEVAEAEPTEAETAEEAAVEAALVEPTVESEAAAASEAEAVVAAPVPSPLAVFEEASAATSERLFRVVREAAETAQALADRVAQAAQAAEAAQQQAQQEASLAATPGDVPDALEADKESDATSLEKPVDWVPGRPLAAEGLDIKTQRPQWATTTRIFAVPRNPVVRIEFRKNGTVARASFTPGRDTGYRDVDGPLLDAIYRWTATGKALDALPAGDAGARVTITMRVILIPERGEMRRSTPKR